RSAADVPHGEVDANDGDDGQRREDRENCPGPHVHPPQWSGHSGYAGGATQDGARFSRNASIPSAASADRKYAVDSSLIATVSALRFTSGTRRSSCFTPATAPGAPHSSASRYRRTVASSSPASTVAVTSPTWAARSPVNVSPVRYSSAAARGWSRRST